MTHKPKDRLNDFNFILAVVALAISVIALLK